MSETHPSDTATSEARLAANRANAQHSTGPRTEEGKARSSQNAVRHGLFSHAVGFPAEPLKEERAIFDAIVRSGRERYQPADAEEELIVDRIAALWWELQRVHKDKQKYIRAIMDKGLSSTEALLAGNAHEVKERRYERAISKLRRDLDFLQRGRRGEICRHTRAEIEAHDRLMERFALEHEKATLRSADRAAGDAVPVPPVPVGLSPVTLPRHAPHAALLAAEAGILAQEFAAAQPAPPASVPGPSTPPTAPASSLRPLARPPLSTEWREERRPRPHGPRSARDVPPLRPAERGTEGEETSGSAFGSDD